MWDVDATFVAGDLLLVDVEAVGELGLGPAALLAEALDALAKRFVGYFAVAPHCLAREEVPGKLGRCVPGLIPAILLTELTLDTPLQGQGLG